MERMVLVALCIWTGEAVHSNSAAVDWRGVRTEHMRKHHSTCSLDTAWGTGQLWGTQRIQSVQPMGFEHWNDEPQHLFVSESAKFAMCIIEKNGCTTWNKALNKLTTGNMANNSVNYNIARDTFNPVAAWNVFSDPLAMRVVVVRDPLERLLSAFLNKCYQGDFGNCIFGTDPANHRLSFSSVLTFFSNNGNDATALNPHFQLQSRHCQLKERIQEYTHISLMTKTGFDDQSICILKEAGLDRLNDQGDGTPVFGAATNQGVSQDEQVSFLKKFYTQDAASTLVQIYQEDYETFHIPQPWWIAQATGEWFNVSPFDVLGQPGSLIDDV